MRRVRPHPYKITKPQTYVKGSTIPTAITKGTMNAAPFSIAVIMTSNSLYAAQRPNPPYAAAMAQTMLSTFWPSGALPKCGCSNNHMNTGHVTAPPARQIQTVRLLNRSKTSVAHASYANNVSTMQVAITPNMTHATISARRCAFIH